MNKQSLSTSSTNSVEEWAPKEQTGALGQPEC